MLTLECSTTPAATASEPAPAAALAPMNHVAAPATVAEAEAAEAAERDVADDAHAGSDAAAAGEGEDKSSKRDGACPAVCPAAADGAAAAVGDGRARLVATPRPCPRPRLRPTPRLEPAAECVGGYREGRLAVRPTVRGAALSQWAPPASAAGEEPPMRAGEADADTKAAASADVGPLKDRPTVTLLRPLPGVPLPMLPPLPSMGAP